MIRHIVSESLEALGHYKLRSFLTMLSVTWGVASLMLLLSYGHGFGTAMKHAFDEIGKNLIVIFPGQTSLQAGGERSGRRVRLEIEDVNTLTEGVPALQAISPEVRRFLPVNYSYRTKDTSVSGVYACYQTIRNLDVEFGRFFTDEDVQQRRRVAVIGANLKKDLFSGLPAEGEEIKINGVRVTVIGVLRKKTQISNYEMPDDMTVFVPYDTLATMVNSRYLNDIVVMPSNGPFRDRIVKDLRASLARAHNFNVRDERAVNILDWNEFRAIVVNMDIALNALLIIIGTLTLTIGAVGVMNIMLVSVTERTREIGVLKALGARRIHVLLQILLEALAITGVGALLGFVIAGMLTYLIGSLPLLGPLFEDTSGQSDIHLSISIPALLISSMVLILVGLVAGLIPAIRAARLDPALSMRSE